jgi:hypothetical protein
MYLVYKADAGAVVHGEDSTRQLCTDRPKKNESDYELDLRKDDTTLNLKTMRDGPEYGSA